MMEEKVAIKLTTLDGICDAVREVEGTAELIPIEELKPRILALGETEGDSKLIEIMNKTVTKVTAKDLEGVTQIPNYAFCLCSQLITATLPDSVTEIKERAFMGCSKLAAITIPSNVTKVGSKAFSSCNKISRVNVPSLAKWCEINFQDIDSLPYYAANAPLYIKNEAGTYELLEGELIIPNTVTKIGNYAFCVYKRITSVIIPNSVTSIGHDAFLKANFTSVIIPDSVTIIGEYCFCNANNLVNMTIGSGMKTIGAYSLCIGNEDNKATITFLSNTPPSLHNTAFCTTTLEKIIVPKGCGEAYKTATNWANWADYIEEAAE